MRELAYLNCALHVEVVRWMVENMIDFDVFICMSVVERILNARHISVKPPRSYLSPGRRRPVDGNTVQSIIPSSSITPGSNEDELDDADTAHMTPPAPPSPLTPELVAVEVEPSSRERRRFPSGVSGSIIAEIPVLFVCPGSVSTTRLRDPASPSTHTCRVVERPRIDFGGRK